MDEATLTAALRSLATEPVVHTSPSADARLRAHRLQWGRRAGAAGLVVVVGLVAGGVTIQQHGTNSGTAGATSDWQRDLAEKSFPNHATSQTVVVMDSKTGSVLSVAYWQNQHLCAATVVSGRVQSSQCASVTPSATAPLTVANLGDGTTFASVRADVREVKARTTDGQVHGLHPMGGEGFPYRVVVATGKVVSLRAYDTAGKQLGDAVAGPDALQIAQVKAVEPCATAVSPLPPSELPDRTGDSCYQLAPTSMTIVPKSVQAISDVTQGWLVTVALNAHDQQAFGELTQRVTTQPAPANQLAFVVDGKVQSAPTIQEAITGGNLQLTGGSDSFSQAQVQALAAELAG
jgi:hypothetical protein